jgi:hypothetical protein
MKKLLITNVLAMLSITAMAQNIDFNMANRWMKEVNEPNYIAWPVNTVQSESKTLDNSMKLTVTACDGAAV